MSDQFFANQASGLLLAGIGLTLGVTKTQNKLFTFIPTMALVGFMIIGICGMDASLCYLAAKMKQKKAMVFISKFISPSNDLTIEINSSKNRACRFSAHGSPQSLRLVSCIPLHHIPIYSHGYMAV